MVREDGLAREPDWGDPDRPGALKSARLRWLLRVPDVLPGRHGPQRKKAELRHLGFLPHEDILRGSARRNRAHVERPPDLGCDGRRGRRGAQYPQRHLLRVDVAGDEPDQEDVDGEAVHGADLVDRGLHRSHAGKVGNHRRWLQGLSCRGAHERTAHGGVWLVQKEKSVPRLEFGLDGLLLLALAWGRNHLLQLRLPRSDGIRLLRRRLWQRRLHPAPALPRHQRLQGGRSAGEDRLRRRCRGTRGRHLPHGR
mmetsp:Transcript_83514/g.233026  ORF Transcript_83514/g.233026 Transcript_83514/m.233026 type:complete len:253 (+) Transcript_83514:1375-2133(+)